MTQLQLHRRHQPSDLLSLLRSFQFLLPYDRKRDGWGCRRKLLKVKVCIFVQALLTCYVIQELAQGNVSREYKSCQFQLLHSSLGQFEMGLAGFHWKRTIKFKLWLKVDL